jgi:hypothetical protein
MSPGTRSAEQLDFAGRTWTGLGLVADHAHSGRRTLFSKLDDLTGFLTRHYRHPMPPRPKPAPPAGVPVRAAPWPSQ